MHERKQASATARLRTAHVLLNLARYYEQFAPRIEAAVASQRKPLEERLTDFIKLARWEDVNYFAMKQAAEKSHRTLTKLAKVSTPRCLARLFP